jgi:nicotinamide-nucleotide amidase
MVLKNIKKILKNLQKKKLTVSIAESCTGGMLSSHFTSLDGASKIFTLGLVTYSNQAKIDVLKVPKNILKKYGSVSEECCFSMVKNLKKISKTNIAISITGIAGPTGGSKSKPVGLVYVGIFFKNKVIIKKNLFNKNDTRLDIQKKTCNVVFKIISSLI